MYLSPFSLADRISNWIATGVREAGKQGAVVGLSGGMDSAVTAALCKKALDNHVFGVIMPCESGWPTAGAGIAQRGAS